jgi:hypothetical protein
MCGAIYRIGRPSAFDISAVSIGAKEPHVPSAMMGAPALPPAKREISLETVFSLDKSIETQDLDVL